MFENYGDQDVSAITFSTEIASEKNGSGRKCMSAGPEWRKVSQSDMMQEMYDRISAYDYKCEIDSHVSKCSFGSFRDLCDANPDFQL